jgi:hypothetical protein
VRWRVVVVVGAGVRVVVVVGAGVRWRVVGAGVRRRWDGVGRVGARVLATNMSVVQRREPAHPPTFPATRTSHHPDPACLRRTRMMAVTAMFREMPGIPHIPARTMTIAVPPTMAIIQRWFAVIAGVPVTSS